MTNHLTLLLTGVLALTALDAPALASTRTHNVVQLTGDVHIEVHGSRIDIDGHVPITGGRIVIGEGGYEPSLGKLLSLMELNLRFSDFYITGTPKGRVDVDHAGITLRNAVSWWGKDLTPPQGLQGIYAVEVPVKDPMTGIQPKLVAAAFAKVEGVRALYTYEDVIAEPITGTVDFEADKVTLRLVVESTTNPPWWQDAFPWVEPIHRRFTVTVTGKILPPGKIEVDPDPVPDPKHDPKYEPKDPKSDPNGDPKGQPKPKAEPPKADPPLPNKQTTPKGSKTTAR